MLPSVSRLNRASTIGWIGLGAMGHPMALNLFSKTFQAHQQHNAKQLPNFLICEQDDTRANAFLQEAKGLGGSEFAGRIERVGSGKEMAVASGKIVTMLPSTPQVEAVYLHESTGILTALKSLPRDTPSLQPEASGSASSSNIHTLLIDQTTLDPTVAVSVATRVQAETGGKALMLDAPVSGGIVAAKAGTLTIMFGSPSPLATELATPLLHRMAREGGVVPCGRNGTGVGVKVCNNLILAINQIGLAEGLALGNALGIDPLLLHNVINTSSGQSWSSKVNSPLKEVANSPGSRNYSGGFQSRLMLKDVGLALHAAHAKDVPLPLGWAAQSVYDSVCKDDEAELATKDFSSVLEWLRRKTEQGVERGWKDGGPGSQ